MIKSFMDSMYFLHFLSHVYACVCMCVCVHVCVRSQNITLQENGNILQLGLATHSEIQQMVQNKIKYFFVIVCAKVHTKSYKKVSQIVGIIFNIMNSRVLQGQDMSLAYKTQVSKLGLKEWGYNCNQEHTIDTLLGWINENYSRIKSKEKGAIMLNT